VIHNNDESITPVATYVWQFITVAYKFRPGQAQAHSMHACAGLGSA